MEPPSIPARFIDSGFMARHWASGRSKRCQWIRLDPAPGIAPELPWALRPHIQCWPAQAQLAVNLLPDRVQEDASRVAGAGAGGRGPTRLIPRRTAAGLGR